MTTTVVITPSSHDVEVFMIDPKTGNPTSLVPEESSNSEVPITVPYRLLVKQAGPQTFYAHSGQDILIREVKDDD